MSTVTRIRLDRRAFRRWLEDQPAARVVGWTRRVCGCPLARWLLARGIEQVVVTGTDWGDSGVTRRPLPPWARSFAHGVDAWGCEFDVRRGVPVTAETARRILAEVAP